MQLQKVFDRQRFWFLYNALNAEGGFKNGEYLCQYPRESSTKFDRRKKVAWYENHLASAATRFAGYLSKRPPVRVTENPLLKKFVEDSDWKGNDLDVFWMNFILQAKARGSMLLAIDMPETSGDTLAQQTSKRLIPYLIAVPPENIEEFTIDATGRLSRVVISDNRVISQNMAAINRHIYDTETVRVEISGQAAKVFQHGLGICPVLAFVENGDFPSFGEFAQIADISLRLYNMRSELDEILRAQTFSLLHYQVPVEQMSSFDSAKVAEAIGTHNMLIHHGDAPGFIAPPDGPATIYQKSIHDLTELIKTISHNVDLGTAKQAESGVALALRFQELNGALTNFARKMEDLERRMWEIVGLWLKIPTGNPIESAWSKDFSLSDVSGELDTLGKYQASNFPPEVIRQKQKSIIALDFSTIDQTVMDEMIAAIDESTFEVPTPAAAATGQTAAMPMRTEPSTTPPAPGTTLPPGSTGAGTETP